MTTASTIELYLPTSMQDLQTEVLLTFCQAAEHSVRRPSGILSAASRNGAVTITITNDQEIKLKRWQYKRGR